MPRNQAGKRGAELAYDGTILSNALQKYLAEKHPDALNFACLPKDVSADRIGIIHNPGDESSTAWHNAAVRLNRNSSPERYGLSSNPIFEIKHNEESKLSFIGLRDDIDHVKIPKQTVESIKQNKNNFVAER